jgi:hypothetical protein
MKGSVYRFGIFVKELGEKIHLSALVRAGLNIKDWTP